MLPWTLPAASVYQQGFLPMILHRKCALALLLAAGWLAAQPVLAPSPGLKYSTYLRDGFTPNAIATDSSGNVYLAGKAIIDPNTQQTAAMVVRSIPVDLSTSMHGRWEARRMMRQLRSPWMPLAAPSSSALQRPPIFR